jgi:peptidoglycan/LPS O-acetylase OafA/YrhL
MIIGLDGLRALAFLGVFSYHTGNLEFGWMGVQLFFVLSGFLITDILLRMKDSLPTKEYAVKFYGRRALRILPVYYFYLLALAALVFVAPKINLGALTQSFDNDFSHHVWYAVFYVYDFFRASASGTSNWHFGHIWSLSVEEQFYLVWPLLIFLTPKKYFKRLCLTAIGLGLVFRLVTTLIFRSHMFAFLLNDPEEATYVLPFSHVDAFAFGAYISRFEIPRPRLQLLAMVILAPAMAMFTDYLITGRIMLANLGYSLPVAGAYKEVWGFTLLDYLFALTIYCVVKTGLLTGILHSSPLRYLGKISYGLYVYHLFIIQTVTVMFRKFGLPYELGSPAVYVTALILTVVVASLSFYLLEKPILNLKTRYFRLSSDKPIPRTPENLAPAPADG